MKHPMTMTLDEAIREFESLDLYFLRCREGGHGINSKESVRFTLCAMRIVDLVAGGRADIRTEYHDMTVGGYVASRASAQISALRTLKP